MTCNQESETQNYKLDVDIVNSCTICMKNDYEEAKINNIFDNNCDILDKILYCTGIKFTKEVGLPTIMCYNCLQDLAIAHKFKTSCVIAYDTFQNFLKNRIKSETNDSRLKTEVYGSLGGDDDWAMNDYDNTSIKEEFFENDKLARESIKESKPRKKRGPYKKSGKPRLKKLKFRRLFCEPCSVKFATKNQLEKHRKELHSQNEESWVCEVCGKLFAHRGSLSSHMRSHLPPEFACDQCDYKTANKYDLNKHLRIHSGEKIFQCQHCSSAYYTSSNLSSHIRHVHEKEKKFACELCEKKFFDRTKYLRHIDSHNNVKRFECEVCHSCFTRRCYWKKHLQRQHNIVIPPQRPGRARLHVIIGQTIGTKS